MSASKGNHRASWDENSLKAEVMVELESAIRVLEQLWITIGLDEEQRSSRVCAVHEHVAGLLREMVAEEQALKQRIERNVDSYVVELIKLCSELDLPTAEFDASASLLRREHEVRQIVDALAAEKSKRLRALKHLSDARTKLHEKLGLEVISTLPSSETPVPNEELLRKLEETVKALEHEQTHRSGVLIEKRKYILDLLDELGIGPSNSFEFDVVVDEPEHFCLSDSNMSSLSALQIEMEKKVATHKAEAERLKKQLTTLWRRLEVADTDQQDFLAGHQGYSAYVLEELKNEVTRCEALKASRLDTMIKKVREEISRLWSVCHFGPEQKSAFQPFTNCNVNDELLEVHEQEVKRLETLYATNAENIYEPLARRAELWASMLEFDARERDPARYTNRGGGLLKEEKERKKVLRELPKVEQTLKDAAAAWELANGRELLVYDARVTDYFRQQWDEYHSQKEEEKMDRQKAKGKTGNDTARFKPPTPMKRPNDGGMSPPKLTPKIRKLNDTATPSGLRSFARQTPCVSVMCASPVFKQPPVTPSSQKKTPGMLTKSISMQSILTPSSKMNTLGSVPSTTKTPMKKSNSGPLGSASKKGDENGSSVPSYREFKGGIANRNRDCHSSTLLHSSK